MQPPYSIGCVVSLAILVVHSLRFCYGNFFEYMLLSSNERTEESIGSLFFLFSILSFRLLDLASLSFSFFFSLSPLFFPDNSCFALSTVSVTQHFSRESKKGLLGNRIAHVCVFLFRSHSGVSNLIYVEKSFLYLFIFRSLHIFSFCLCCFFSFFFSLYISSFSYL